MSIKANKDNAVFISKAYLQEDGDKASATVTFATNPIDGQNITLNGTVFTYRTAPAVANDVAIGASISASINNLLTEALPATATYTKVGTNQIYIEYKIIGTVGNSYTIASNFLTVPSNLSGGSNTPDADWVDNAPSIEYKLPKIIVANDSTTTALKSTDVLVEGDEVRLYNGADGLVEGSLGTTTDQSVSMLEYTTANGFTCTYDYQSKFHKHNITKDTTVSDITGWTTGTSLPGVLYSSQAIVTKSRVYLLGGANATTTVSTVYTAPINIDGTLGSWATGTSLPGALYGSQVIVTKSRVYLLGGSASFGTSVSTVYTAPINIDGTLGSWATGTSLPGALSGSQAIVTKSRVYLLGGQTTGAVSTVYTAPINIDGTLGTWTTGTSLTGVLGYSQAIVTKGRVYLLGGYNGTTSVSTVYTAPINIDGTLGSWATGTSLPGALSGSQAIVTKSRVYLLGGAGASTVYTAPINIDGTLGTWTTGTSLPGALYYSQAIVTKSRVYLLGGAGASTVYTTPIADGWGIEENNYQIVTSKYTADISLLGLTAVPTKAYFDKPVSIVTDTADIEANIDIATKMPSAEVSDTYDNVNDKFIKTYSKIEQQGRAMKYKISSDSGVEITKVNIKMNKQG